MLTVYKVIAEYAGVPATVLRARAALEPAPVDAGKFGGLKRNAGPTAFS